MITKWLYAKWKGDTDDGSRCLSGWEVFEFDTTLWTPDTICDWIFKHHPVKELAEVDIYEMIWEQPDE